MARLLAFLKLIALSKTAILGAALVTSALLADAILVIGELFIFESNPYMGIVVYMVFPGMAAFGLALIPLGVWRKLKRLGGRTSGETVARLRKINRFYVIQVVFTLSMTNLVIFSVIGYRGFHYTESREFCGELCHEVMHPELNAYRRSPHSEISCVECHIGAGAKWFVKSKLSGARQVLAVTFDTYSRPIETPIHNLRPARDVCEVCHRPELFHGNLFRVLEQYASDEQNTRTYTILNMRVGGGGDGVIGEGGVGAHGIHWHVSKDHKVRYYHTDRRREDIVWVELTKSDGTRRVWTRPGTTVREEDLDEQSTRVMDCVDCHNRPTHIYEPPDKALDHLLATGQVDASIPWIRKVAETVLTRKYASNEEAMDGIAELPKLFEEQYPEVWREHREGIERAVGALQQTHLAYVYPSMNIQWNTYPSLIGHPTQATKACFRCHDGVLRDEAGVPITVECNACHFVLAKQEKSPVIMQLLQKP